MTEFPILEGINLADEYISNQIERFGLLEEWWIQLVDPTTQAFTRLFLMNWYINREISDFDQYHLENPDTICSVVSVSHTAVGRKLIYQMKWVKLSAKSD